VQPYLAFDQLGPEPALMLPLSCQNALDSGDSGVSPEIRDAFANARRALPIRVARRVVTRTAEWWLGEEGQVGFLYVLRRRPTGIAVYQYPSPSFSPRNFYLDTRGSGDRRQHLRQVVLADASKSFDYSVNKSWGVFHQANLDAVIVHPRGYAIGVSYQNHKMEILPWLSP
jgi:hypothetical protein